MTAALLNVADAVTAEIAAATWSLTFTPTRENSVSYKRRELPDLTVVVVPVSTDFEQLTRGSKTTILDIDIGVLQKPENIEKATIDPLVSLADEIAAFFHGRTLTALPRAFCSVSRPDPIYDHDVLDVDRTFQSVLRLEFRVYP